MIDDERADAEISVPLYAFDVCEVRAFVDEIKRIKAHTLGRHAPRHNDDLELLEMTAGKLGEVAFGRCFGCGVDWTIYPGGDHGYDFRMWTGDTIDVKAIAVERNLDHDYRLPLFDVDLTRGASHFVQVLISPCRGFGLITGAISRTRFKAHAIAVDDPKWDRHVVECPRVVTRSQLSRAFPVAWFLEPPAPGEGRPL